MKKVLGILAVLMVFAFIAPAIHADQYYQEVTVITTNGGTAYGDVNVAGFLDKIEYTCVRGTSTFTLATFNSTTAIDTFATKQVTAAGSGVIRPRTLGTDTGGTTLTGSATYGNNATNALGQSVSNFVYSTTLTARYERFRIGGNAKIRIVENDEGDTAAITNVFRIYLVPEDR